MGAGHQMKDFRYYRCSGSDGYRFGGERICGNAQVHGEFLESAVWHEGCDLLTHPERLEHEYQKWRQGWRFAGKRRDLEGPAPQATTRVGTADRQFHGRSG